MGSLRDGDRIELHPATDEWMQGDRYGTIVTTTFSESYGTVTVSLDKSGRMKKFSTLDIAKIIEPVIHIGDCVTLNADDKRNPIEFTVTASPSKYDVETIDIVDREGHLYHPLRSEVTLCYRREAVQ